MTLKPKLCQINVSSFQTESIFESVRSQVLSAVSSSPFLHPDTRARAADKVRTLRGDFLGSTIYFNSSLIRARYGDLGRMRGGDFFSNVMSMFAHFRASVYHFLSAPVDADVYTWNLVAFPFTVNAFHLQQLNSIGEGPFALSDKTKFKLFMFLNSDTFGSHSGRPLHDERAQVPEPGVARTHAGARNTTLSRSNRKVSNTF